MGTQSAVGCGEDPAHAGLASCAELIRVGARPELLVFLALRRAAGGGVAKFDDHYLNWGYPTPSWLAGMFAQLTRTGLLALAEQDSAGLQRISLSPAGQLRYQQLSALPRRVPDPVPAAPGRTALFPAPGGPGSARPQGTPPTTPEGDLP